MKLKLTIAIIIMLGSAGCVTSTNSYTRDIVYRDGSYYSPADEQYGDYYYEPEPDYSAYSDNYYYGFNSSYYGNSWYSSHDSYHCRFSYYHDRYCHSGWGNSFLNFGGLTIFFGNSNHHGYDYGYGNGYGYGYPYYSWYSPRPRPHSNEPIPMPKQRAPINGTPDYSFNNGPGMRVPGEPIRISTKPAVLDEQDPATPIAGSQDQRDRNPYTRTRHPRPNIQPEIWRNDQENNVDQRIVIGNDNEQERPNIPALLIEEGAYADETSDKPVRDNRRLQPYPRQLREVKERQQVVIVDNSDTAPVGRARRDDRQERPAPRIQQRERAERTERSVRESRTDSNDEGSGGN
jgi:hypothetical protein